MRDPAQNEAIASLADISRFRRDDPDALVLAALACPFCLPVDAVKCDDELEGYDPSVQCRCPSCQARWRVYLAADQALALGLMPWWASHWWASRETH